MPGLILWGLCLFVVVGVYCQVASPLHNRTFLFSWDSLHWRLSDLTKIDFWTGSFSSSKEGYAGQRGKNFMDLFSHIWRDLSVRDETKTILSLPAVVRANFPNAVGMPRPPSVMFMASCLARLWLENLACVISLSITEGIPQSQIVSTRNIHIHALN